MKNSNLLNRLLSYSHEKQSPQRFGRYAAMLIMLLTLGVGQMWGSTTLTMYYAVGADIVACNTPKCYYNCGWDQTGDVEMTKTDYTKDGKLIYSITVTAEHDGFDGIYFKPKGWSGEGSQEQTGCSTWTTASNFSNKMYVHGSGWTSYSKDASYTVYFVNNSSWTTPKAYAWNSACDYNAAYATSGTMTNTSKTYNSKEIWSITFDKRYASLIFNSNGSDTKTGDLTLGTTNAGKMFTFATSTTAWSALAYDVTLNKDGGSGTGTTSIIATCGSAMPSGKAAPGTALSGYSFQGYYTAAGGGGTQYYTSAMASANNWPSNGSGPTTLYAKWTQTLNLNGNGATSAGTTSVTATYKGGITSISSNPSKTGYDFQGYYPNANGTGSQVINTSKALQTSVTDWTNSSTKWIHTGSSTLYAKWTQTVTLNSNTSYGGKSGGNGSAGVIFNGAKTSYTAAQASSASYALKGYYTAETGGTEVIDKDGNVKANITNWTDEDGNWIHAGSSTLYAQWKTTYTLHYEGNGNTGGTAPDDEEWTMNTTATVAGNTGSLVKTNYAFGGWNTLPGGNGTNYAAGTGTFTISANTNLYAKWNEVMRDITIVGGTTSSTTAGVVTTGSATAAAPAAGKKFTGWNIGAGVTLTGCVATDRTITFTATADATVTAQYADRAQVKMYFAKPTTSGWTNAYAYVWKSSDDTKKNKAYPGVQLASTEAINNVTYYTYQYYTEGDGIGGAATGSSEWNSVIFCNGASGDDEKKTGNLTVSNGHYYFRSSTGTGKAAAVTSAWCIKGSWNSWSEDTDQITHSTAAAGSKSITLTTGNKTFKIYNIVEETWWRFSGDVTATKAATAMANNIDGNMTITPSVAGPYTFALTNLTTTPTLAITYPTTYTVTFNAETFVNDDASHSTSTGGGTLSAVDGNSAALASGGKVISGGTAVITASKKDGYSFIGFYTSADCTTPISGAGVSISDNVLTLSSISGNKTVYAKFSENMTTVNLVASPTGKGTFTKDAATVTSVKAGKTTHPTVTAVAGSGYSVNTSATVWSESSSYISISATNAASTTITATGESGKSADLTATFTPNQYTITLKHHNGEDDGSVSVTYDDDANLTSSVTPPTKTGYTFGGYYTGEGGTGDQLIEDDGDWITNNAYIDEDGKWVNAGDVTLHAKWTAKTTTISFSQTGTGYGSGGQSDTKTATYDAAMPTTISVPTAANGYAFMGYYDALEPLGTQYYDETGASARTWNKEDATATLYAYFKQAEITGITFTDGAVVAPKTSKTVTAVISPTPTGTTTVCWRVLYSNDNPMDPQPSFSSVSGNSVSFTAPAASGMYKMEAVLHLGSGCGGEELSTYVANFQVAGDHEVTVQYKDASGNVIAASGSVTGKPLEWSSGIEAPEIFGYTFHHWLAGDGVTLSEDGTNAKAGARADSSVVSPIYIKAVYDGRLTAVYNQNAMIYFKNTLGWENVYVNFHTGNAWNNTDNGSGSPKGVGNSGLTNANKHMTRIGDTDVWYYDYGYNNGGSSISPSLYISFTDQSRPSASEFWDANPGINVSYPANYADAISTDKSSENGFKAATPMFVPLSGIDPVAANVSVDGKANYYNRGYWTTYTAGTGYILEIYYDNDASSCIQSIPFTSADDLMPMKAVVDLEAGTTYRYQVRRGGTSSAGIYYGNTGTMTYADHGVGTGWIMENTMAGGFKKAKITTNASGNYTFNLSYSPNASNEYRLRMEVDYPIANNDYRLVYSDATQTKPIISAIVTKANNSKDTVSFFIRPASAALVIQQATVTKEGAITWNAYSTITSWVSGLAKDSVYNICLTMNESGAISVENVEAYTGNFYIRTNAAGASKWDNYRSSDHLMTYSEYSATNADYSHYFMAYVGNGTNVKFVVANDYSPSISDTITVQTYRGGDSDHVAANGDIKADANVRFMWNRHNNGAYRAYLAAAKSDGSKFLVLRANSNTDLMDENGNALLESATSGQAGYNHGAPNNSMQFIDDENWIYETTVKIKPGAFLKLYANFHDADFYYKGENNSTFDKDNAIQLLGGSGDAEKIRVIYDFKTDRLVSAWMPTGDINEVKEIYADVMFVREHQGDIEQLTFSKGDGEAMGAITKIETAYGVLRFNKWTINNKSKADGHAVLDPGASRYERDLFYVSFPFRVAMNEVFGFGTYGKHWIIEYYDGAARAANGFWADTPSYWRFVTDRKGKFFEPNQGYIIALDLDEMGESSEVWDNGVENVELYFPSYGEMGDITNSTVTYSLPSHECTINRPTADGNRTIKDSHWNVMSVPTYVNTSNVTFSNTTWTATRPSFLYEWNMDDNSLTPRSGSGYTYHAMHAYMVQYNGNVTWTSTSVTPASVAARRAYAEAPQNVEFRLELRQNEQIADQTFVRLSNDEEVSADFAFGEDMSKEFNKTRSNIYTFIGTEQVAGNVLPLTEQTTVVPVGVVAKTNGDYTFSIPDGTEGIGVTLIDNETGIRTSLTALEYTINLSAGDYADRFILEISPISQISTDVESISDEGLEIRGARKIMIDGLLYIVKDGKLFDAQGKRVQ